MNKSNNQNIQINKSMNIYFLFSILIIVLLFFGIFLRTEFATDTYSRMDMTMQENLNDFIQNGRYLTAIWWGIVTVLNLGINEIYLSSYLIAIISLVFSIYKLFRIINDSINNDKLAFLLSIFIIINPFSIELGIMILSLFFSILALEQFILYLQNHQNKNIVFAMIFLLFNNISYQGTLAFFTLLGSLYIILNSKTIKEFIKNNVIMFLIYGMPTLICRLFLAAPRLQNSFNFSTMITKLKIEHFTA